MSTTSYQDRIFWRGLFCGMLLIIGSDGVHWFISSSLHPDASTARTVAVALQVGVSYCVAAWLFFRSRQRSGTAPAA